ncbi:MAG: GlsB/YeaQ/YmgE family stress response membrane protein [Desulfoarculaceae bacterium]|nr:GlsB/YeaQ/YmgE family stress response membrane protein [Desulfoarculaceae bacterium]
MDITGLLIFIATGAVAGWLAGIIMKGGGFGLLSNILIGIIGGVVGGFLLRMLAMASGGILGSIVIAAVGAVALLFFVERIKKG